MSGSMLHFLRSPLILLVLPLLSNASQVLGRNWTTWEIQDASYQLSTLASIPSLNVPEKCPPCFNCLLPAFTCGQYGECNPFDGQCKCPAGWGGVDCLIPQCGSLADGEHRNLREDGRDCECNEGWGGINCNVCQNDDACTGFPLAGEISTADVDATPNMTCYKGGKTIFNNHQMCDVTNRKILDMLPGRPPQVTFSCETKVNTCSFQFWVGKIESFYCALESCVSSTKHGYDTNSTSYTCEKLKCSCIPGRFICGEDGSINIDDFLEEEIKGPATFSCQSGQGCKFEEPAMNGLIVDVFGDPYITLECDGGECLHHSQVPGYVAPAKPDSTKWVALSTAGAIFFVIVAFGVVWYAGRDRVHGLGPIRLPDNEASRLMTDHIPAALHFSDISYTIGSRTILESITGSIKPGQVMAIMGASGAGKTTFLDILARKRKRGIVGGTTLVNGRDVSDSDFKKIMGFVDQEDTLMSTLTVYETVLYSALLRLPREMSLHAKKYRTLETLHELGILGIKDSRIGDSGHRSISGGEKRRVSIACELVTSPSILFLDEPTSGLDAFNAFNVVESLVSLARNYERTVVFTIHQPRSNIVALFDQLVLLAQGRAVYSGELSKCQGYFDGIGQGCPPGFNIADYLIDLTVRAGMKPREVDSPPTESSSQEDTNLGDEERVLGFAGGKKARSSQSSNGHSDAARSSRSATTDETELQTRPNSVATETSSFVKRKTSQLLGSFTNGSQKKDRPITPQLASLIQAYAASDIASSIRAEIETYTRRNGNEELPDVVAENALLRGRKGATWVTQFRILSGRAFKNLYRDPALLTAHYLSSIALALICGFLYHDVANDMAGFQNRLGVFFFTLALFGFSCLSSLGLFANERILFMRERANGYYSTLTYFSSKILFDILPLRVVPPLVFGAIVYRLVGLVPEVAIFWKFMLTLVLFNLATASVVLLISIAFASTSVASLVGTLVMLFNLLFTGLLVNRNTLGTMEWLINVSFFHAAFEALAVNELRYLQLKEVKYGVELDVPAATILNIFGLRAQSFWWPNTALLGIFFGTFTVVSWLVLHFYVREKR